MTAHVIFQCTIGLTETMTAQWLNQSKTQKTWFDLKIVCKSVLPLPCLHSSSSPPGFGWVLISFKPENTDEDEKHCYVHYTDGKDNIVDQPVEEGALATKWRSIVHLIGWLSTISAIFATVTKQHTRREKNLMSATFATVISRTVASFQLIPVLF